jgi:hypothetical protein
MTDTPLSELTETKVVTIELAENNTGQEGSSPGSFSEIFVLLSVLLDVAICRWLCPCESGLPFLAHVAEFKSRVSLLLSGSFIKSGSLEDFCSNGSFSREIAVLGSSGATEWLPNGPQKHPSKWASGCQRSSSQSQSVLSGEILDLQSFNAGPCISKGNTEESDRGRAIMHTDQSSEDIFEEFLAF